MATPSRNANPPSYFVDQRKGEVNELKALLRNLAIERDPKRKREVIKKVIAYMTLGFDVSRLFGEMVMASSTTDIIVKKMCYLYLSNYSQSNEELATLCINTMTKDCQDQDPLVRGLALRSLSSLRLVSTLEYLLPVLAKGLNDGSGYVRRNAVMAVLKLHDVDKDLVLSSGMVKQVEEKVYDVDSSVSYTALMVLGEILLEQGGIELTRDLVIHLLNRLKEYDEWGQCIILGLVAKYVPTNPDEMFAIMNILDGCLRVVNSAVVLATIKCFMRYADAMKTLKQQIFLRIKEPLLTLLSCPSHEMRFAVLKHVEIIVPRCPGIFDDQFKRFYCDYTEPLHLKFVKLRILPALTNEHNVHELVNELSEYVNDIDPEISKRAIYAFGQIALKLPGGADGVINQLIEFINMDVEYVRVQVVKVIKDLLRKFPDRAGDVLPALPRCLRLLEDPEGKAAVIFMLTEYGADNRPTPYLLEPLVDGYEEETSVEVKMALLVGVTKLFFKRAPEVHSMLRQLLEMMVNDFSDSDLHDRALLFYRLLRYDVDDAKRCLEHSSREKIWKFAEEEHGGLKQRLYEEFNTLSVMFDKPADQFIDEQYLESSFVNITFAESDIPENLRQQKPQPSPTSQRQLEEYQREHHQLYHQEEYDYGGSGSSDLLGFGGGAPSPRRMPWALQSNVTINQDAYQSYWTQLPVSASLDIPLSSCPPAEDVERLASSSNIYCMASGDLGDALKFFFFGKDTEDTLFLAEVVIDKHTAELSASVKSADTENAQTFADSLMASLGALL